MDVKVQKKQSLFSSLPGPFKFCLLLAMSPCSFFCRKASPMETRDRNRSGVGWQRAAGDTKWVFTFVSTIFGFVSEPGEMGCPTREILKGKDI